MPTQEKNLLKVPLPFTACLSLGLAILSPVLAEQFPEDQSGDHLESRQAGGTLKTEGHGRWKGGFGSLDGRKAMDGFPHLEEAEREKIRSVLQKVLSNPEVVAARGEMKSASETFKATLRSAIEEEDPDLAPVLQRILKGRGAGRHSPPQRHFRRMHLERMGGGRNNALQKDILDNLRFEILPAILDSRRRELREAHETVRQSPEVQAVFQKLKSTSTTEEKRSLNQELRSAYLKEMKAQLPEFRDLMKGEAKAAATDEVKAEASQP